MRLGSRQVCSELVEWYGAVDAGKMPDTGLSTKARFTLIKSAGAATHMHMHILSQPLLSLSLSLSRARALSLSLMARAERVRPTATAAPS